MSLEVKAYGDIFYRESYDLAIDVVLVDLAQEAVMDWQSKHGLRLDGIICSLT